MATYVLVSSSSVTKYRRSGVQKTGADFLIVLGTASPGQGAGRVSFSEGLSPWRADSRILPVSLGPPQPFFIVDLSLAYIFWQ